MLASFVLPGLLALAAAACSSAGSADPPDPARAEGGSGADGPVGQTNDEDGGPGVDGGKKKDATAGDGGDDGLLGTLTSGACGTLKAELLKATPSVLNNAIAFAAGEAYDKPSLSPGGQRLFDTPNAGGSSTESETMSYEVLRHCEGAVLLKTETEITYEPPDPMAANTITDILMEIDGKKIGVSVTRTYKPSSQGPMTDDAVKALLEKKLIGIIRSSERVLPADKWVKQVFHVFSPNKASTDAIARVIPTIDAAVRADTIILVTETKGGGFVYCHPLPPLGMECP